jgi:hydroxymethylpyrimidine/phosphomethylpyrimidine kinase
MHGRVLIIAGSDSGGGAGIQADIKTVTANGGFAATAITALTAQNTQEVRAIFPVPPAFIREQMLAVLEDIGADALKTGMLHDAPVIEMVAEVIAAHAASLPLVVDPVMVAESGAQLLQGAAVQALSERLLPLASVITPNLPEAEVLLGERIPDTESARAAAQALRTRFGCAVLLKGGHLAGETITDVLVSAGGQENLFEGERIVSRSTHGTGCTLASALAVQLARGVELVEAVAYARFYLREAIATAVPLGGGHGPVNHGHTVRA